MTEPETTTPTVASRGKGQPPSPAQRRFFATRIADPRFTDAERERWTQWGATIATRKTMSELCDWLAVERQRRTRATCTAAGGP
jgi:hypothetical protein